MDDSSQPKQEPLIPARRLSALSHCSLTSSKRRKLLRGLKGKLVAERPALTEQLSLARGTFDRGYYKALLNAQYRITDPDKNSNAKFFRYNNNTLELLLEHFNDGSFIEAADYLKEYYAGLFHVEPLIREVLSYRHVLKGQYSGYAVARLEEIRENVPGFAYEDLSELEGEKHEQVAAMLEVSIELTQGKSHDDIRRTHMGNQLASVIIDYPTRKDDIINYVRSRGIEATNVNREHLIHCLESPVSALNSGVL